MPKRAGFQSSIQEFLTKSNDEVLGKLTKFQEGSAEKSLSSGDGIWRELSF